MRHFGIALLVLVAGLLCTGWKETSRLIRVNKNGTGVIYVRVLVNPQYLGEGQKVYDEAKLKAANYGEGVRYQISQELKKTKRGWVGYLAKYQFSDISKLRIFPASLPRAMTAEKNDPIRKDGWRFRLTEVKHVVTEEEDPGTAKELLKKVLKKKDEKPKKVMSLEIIPLRTEIAAEEDDDDDADDDDDDDVPENQQLKAQQRGRRCVTYLQVDGVVDTEKSNAPYVSKKKPNTIILNDEQYAVIWNHGPLARKEAAEEEPYLGSLGKDTDVEGWRTVAAKAKILFQ